MTIYQKVIAAYGILRSAINGRMSKYDIAQEFRDRATYAVGRLVIYDDKLYRCTTAHTGSWDANDFVQSTVEEAIIYEVDKAVLAASAEFAEKTDIASEFSPSERYDVNRLVVYDHVLYRCSVAHPADEWNGDHFVQATVDDVIALNGGLRNIADDFDKTKSYSVGQLVVYDNKLYRCTSAHTGDWTSGHFTTSTVEAALALKASISDLADEFEEGAYSVGQLVKKDGKIYRCTTAHTGAWNGGADFIESTVSGALNLMATKAELSELGSSTDSALSGKIGLDKISEEFSTETSYSVGQLVKKGGKLYRCTAEHAAGSWNDGVDFTESPVSGSVNIMATKSEVETKIGLDNIAEEFSTGTAYSVGQIVKKGGKLYRCTAEHAAGSWNDGVDFTEAPVSVSLNQMATNIASLNSTIAQTALKSELGYSGRSYDIDVSDDVGWINVNDMEVAVLHLSYSGGDPSSISIDLPEVESEDENGNFHAARCFIIVDTSEIDDGEHMPNIEIGSADDTVLWSSMAGYFEINACNFLLFTYMGRNVWYCEQQYISIRTSVSDS